MRGLARCLAGDAAAVFGHPAGEGAWALHRTSRLACRSERREQSERGGGGVCSPGRDAGEERDDERVQTRRALAKRRQRCLVPPALLGQGVDLAPES